MKRKNTKSYAGRWVLSGRFFGRISGLSGFTGLNENENV
jgi:hypothetical protein